jgi:hypothetical protein
MIAQLPVFPCNIAKEPIIAGGFKSARRGANTACWELVGFATGQASGIDVLDIDPVGLGWYSANFDALPQTRAHSTQRGLHLLFRHAPGLRCSTGRVAPGVDVRADGGYAIWWPREGLPVEDWPICEWPDWLLAEAMGTAGSDRAAANRYLSTPRSSHEGRESHVKVSHVGGVAGSWTEALFKLDPVCWRNKYDPWLLLMMACKGAGISVDDFTRWSTQDPEYADQGDVIRRKWESVEGKHGGALGVVLKQAGIKVRPTLMGKSLSAEVPISRGAHPLRKTHHFNAPAVKPRLDGIMRWLRRNTGEGDLFSAACLFAEIMAQQGVAMKLLEQAAEDNGLRAKLGKEGVRKTIGRAFGHVEEKLASAKRRKLSET